MRTTSRKLYSTRRLAADPYEEEEDEVYDDGDLDGDWSIDKHYWGMEAEDGEITHVRLGNWSDAGWHWSDDGGGLLIFLYRIINSQVGGEFIEELENPEVRDAVERTFQENVAEEIGFNSLAYAFTGDNAGWHFGENDRYVSERFSEDIEYQLEHPSDGWLGEALQNALADVGLDIHQIDERDLASAVDGEIDWGEVSADENKIVGEFEENLSNYFNFDSVDAFITSVEEQSSDVNYDLYEALDEAVYSADPFGPDFAQNVAERLLEEYEPHVGEDESRQHLYTPDPRQQKLPFNASAAARRRFRSTRR